MAKCTECDVTLEKGVTDKGAVQPPVTTSGTYALNGGFAYFFWDNGRLRNNPPVCCGCFAKDVAANCYF
jgi:hypothetical protein